MKKRSENDVTPFSRKVEGRFWAKVDKSAECWVWTGMRLVGYGAIVIDKRRWLAHRISYSMAKGSIPEGAQVLHNCDNRRCVRPDHLRVGTAADNVHDAVERNRGIGRPMQGEQYLLAAVATRLTAAEAAQLVEEAHTKDISMAKLLRRIIRNHLPEGEREG